MRSMTIAAFALICVSAAASVAVADADTSLVYCLNKLPSGDFAQPTTADCGPTSVAMAFYNKSMMTTGWDVLKVTPLNWTDAKQAYYYAGYIEGYLTQDTMWATYQNSVASQNLTTAVTAWVDEHIAYIRATAATATTPFWAQVAKLLKQIDGLAAGYSAAVPAATPAQALTVNQIFYLSFQAEFADIFVITQNNITCDPLGLNRKSPSPVATTPSAGQAHCSAFVKYTGDDLFFTHDTWTAFTDMYRQFKVYNFETNVSMSGYPGVIHSIDDWYQTSHKLAVMETTNLLYNNTLYHWVCPTSVSEFLRVMTANYLATNGSYWMELVQTQNSGTYNNQWMVVDMKLVTLGATMEQAIPNGTFWVYEQLPGPFGRFADLSWHLRKHSYWKSYNLPYFPEVYTISGNQMMENIYGSYFSYEKYARPQIFIREHAGVKTLDDVKRLMRYNNYTTEPFSLIPNCSGEPNGKCTPAYSAMLTISSRGDLDPMNTSGMGPLATAAAGNQIGAGNIGGIDNKIASYKMMMADPNVNVGTLVCGPTQSGGLRPFDWTPAALFAGMSRLMLPDVYNFDYTVQTSATPPYVVVTPTTPPAGVATNAGLAAGVIIGALAFVALLFFAVRQFQKHTQAKYGKTTEASPLNVA